MAMPVGDATDVNTLVEWAMGARVRWPGGPEVTAAKADQAAKRLVAKAYKTLSAGLLPEEADLSHRVVFDLSDPDVLHVLTQALEDYADHATAMAEREDASESFARWADLAVQMRDRAQVAGGLA